VKSTLLWRNRVGLTSGLLMILSLHLISNGVKAGSIALRPAVATLTALSPVQSALNGVAENSTGFVRNYFDLVNVRRDNERLKSELALMRTNQSRLVELETENKHLADLLSLNDALGGNSIAANVIGSDANGLARTLVINQGSSSGLRVDMAVLSFQGVVGKTIEVSRNASRVLLIDDHNSALDAFDQRTRARGIVAGIVDDGITMKYVERSQDIRPDDIIVTSGLDGIFQRGLLIGSIKSVSGEGPGMFLNVTIAPAVDFRSLEQVLVITQMPEQPEASQPGTKG
jgi:rod shape-determining protein MreC